MDVLGSAFGLLSTAPILIGTALAVRASMGRPVLFKQARVGLDAKRFALLKFRTMRPPLPGEESSAADIARQTRLGTFLRKTSIDELPSLWCVLKGDMSLVGPRPLLVQYLERYSPEQARRHLVKPGITGWAQVNGRNSLSWDEKFALDVWYVDHQSLFLDLGILAMTVCRVLMRTGINAENSVTMSEFMGSPAGDSPLSS